MSVSKAQQLMQRVGSRQRIASAAGRFYFYSLIFGGLYLILLLVSRLLALIPPWFHGSTVLIVPAIAVVAAVLLHRRPKPTETARLIDARAKTNDLFLTTALIEKSAGEFQRLVLKDAAEKAEVIQPRQVVPFAWQRKTAHACIALAALAALALFLPQFDPFGKDLQRTKARLRHERLVESRKSTKERRAEILQKMEEGGRSVEVKKAIEQLIKEFKDLKPGEKEQNLEKLMQNQRELAQLWREMSKEKLKNATSQTQLNQQFGGGDAGKINQWKEELKKGEMQGLKRHLEELRKKTEQMAQKTDGLEKEKLKDEIRQALEKMSEALADQLNSQEARNALARAMEQLEMSNAPGLSDEALQGLKESLELSEQEIANLTQAIKDLQSLEQALKALQMAKQLNAKQGLDGSKFAGEKSMEGYAEMFRKMMEQAELVEVGKGMGPGGKPAAGGKTPEDETAKTDFKPEQSKTALQAGEMLLQWKTRGVSDPGEAKIEFEKNVKNVKQGVSEAILQEQVPPGYHEAIRKYFDTLEKSAEKPGDKQTP